MYGVKASRVGQEGGDNGVSVNVCNGSGYTVLPDVHGRGVADNGVMRGSRVGMQCVRAVRPAVI